MTRTEKALLLEREFPRHQRLTADNYADWGAKPMLVRDGAAALWWKVLGDELEVQSIAVRKAARGRGLARRLLRRAYRKARELHRTRVVLDVYEDNIAAQCLYLSEGFEYQSKSKRHKQFRMVRDV